MRELGYAYAIIGGTDSAEFCKKNVNTKVVQDPEISVHENLIRK